MKPVDPLRDNVGSIVASFQLRVTSLAPSVMSSNAYHASTYTGTRSNFDVLLVVPCVKDQVLLTG